MRTLTSGILFLFCFHSFAVQAQKEVEIYRTIRDYIHDQADTARGIRIEKRSRGQIYMVGGNDYKIKSANKKLNTAIKKEVWAVKADDSLYLNCSLLQLGLWYAYAEEINEKLYFTAAITMNREERQRMALVGAFGGPVAAGLAGGDLALQRFYYVMNLKTGQSRYLSRAEMLQTLHSYPELTEKYKKERKPENMDTLKYYLTEIKKRN